MKKAGLIVIVFLAGLIGRAWGVPLTLPDALQTALKQNPEVRAAKKSWEAAKEKVTHALALKDPEIGLEYEQIPAGSTSLDDGMKMYVAKQEIMFPGKIYAEYHMAQAGAQIADALYQAKKLEISSQVKKAYYDLFLADRSISVMDEVKGFLSALKKTAEARYVAGQAMQMDVLQANIEFLTADNELLTMQKEREVKESRLASLLATPEAGAIEVAQELELPSSLRPSASFEKPAQEKRPEILAMMAELKMSDYAHLNAKMDYFPDTMLKYKKRSGDGWDAMFEFTVPLYFWKQNSGVASAGFDREAAEAQLQNMRNMTAWDVKESYIMAEAAQRTLKLYQEKVLPQTQQAIKQALSAYASGKTDFLTVLQAERMFKEAKLKFFESQAEFGKGLAELSRIAGGEQ